MRLAPASRNPLFSVENCRQGSGASVTNGLKGRFNAAGRQENDDKKEFY
jgi:hypothetical protein